MHAGRFVTGPLDPLGVRAVVHQRLPRRPLAAAHQEPGQLQPRFGVAAGQPAVLSDGLPPAPDAGAKDPAAPAATGALPDSFE